MPFNSKISKTIQIRIATDDKLGKVIKKVEANEGIKLKSRDQVIDTLATRHLSDSK